MRKNIYLILFFFKLRWADFWRSAAYHICSDSTASDNVARIDGYTTDETKSMEIVKKFRPWFPDLSASVYFHDEIFEIHMSKMSGIFTGNTDAGISLSGEATLKQCLVSIQNEASYQKLRVRYLFSVFPYLCCSRWHQLPPANMPICFIRRLKAWVEGAALSRMIF